MVVNSKNISVDGMPRHVLDVRWIVASSDDDCGEEIENEVPRLKKITTCKALARVDR